MLTEQGYVLGSIGAQGRLGEVRAGLGALAGAPLRRGSPLLLQRPAARAAQSLPSRHIPCAHSLHKTGTHRLYSMLRVCPGGNSLGQRASAAAP